MKRAGNLFSQIISFDNLLQASKKAQLGKRFKENVGKFNFNLEKELLKLKDELSEGTHQPGKYRSFYIYEPKKRLISAAPYRDRIVHHALCNIIEPVFEKTFIYDSYANRKGKGTHKAIKRCQDFARKNKYVLKSDIRKYFPSIDHQLLKVEIRKKIKCPDSLSLIDLIIANSNDQEKVMDYFYDDDLFTIIERKKGIPIGNLTSQFFANIYLNPLDHFIKEQLGCKYYIRYVDDFVLFHDDKSKLHNWHLRINQFLDNYRIKLHENKTTVFPVNHGISFLGHRVFPEFRLLKNQNVRKFRKRLRKQYELINRKEITQEIFYRSLESWAAHAAFSDTYHLRLKISKELEDKGINAQKMILRGGSFNNNPINTRAANRNRNTPENSNKNIGFRVSNT